MIKVNAVSGFLGAGKTTLIKHLATALIENNEKVVILENEFGKVGIDGKMLELEGLSVYEISSGCICCTLKLDFISTLIRIADDICPDRILIEPSGIFVLSEMYDIFKNPQIKSRLTLFSALTVIDSINFLRQRTHYGYFFENQISYADMLILSKINDIDQNTLFSIMEELQRINPSSDIISDDWSDMSNNDFVNLLEVKNYDAPFESPKLNTELSKNNKRHSHNKHGEHNFMAFGMVPLVKYSMSCLKEKLSSFADGRFGELLRAKGYVQKQSLTGSGLSDDKSLNSNCLGENGMLEFNYVDGTFEILQITQEIKPSVCFIGKDLDKKGILEFFI